MATMDVELGAVTIPAACLEDVRCALVDGIESDSSMLTVNQAALVAKTMDPDTNRADRDSAAGSLRKDVQLLDQLLDATDDTKVTAEPDTLSYALEQTARVLSRRLTDVCQYGPLPMGDVVELSARLRWVADEAIRIYPGLDHRLSDDDAVA